MIRDGEANDRHAELRDEFSRRTEELRRAFADLSDEELERLIDQTVAEVRSNLQKNRCREGIEP